MYVKPAPITGVCTACNQRIRVKKDGMLWRYRHQSRKKLSDCSGSGIPPRPGSVKRKWPYRVSGSVRAVSGGAFEANRRRH
jgi:hypothetical protein